MLRRSPSSRHWWSLVPNTIISSADRRTTCNHKTMHCCQTKSQLSSRSRPTLIRCHQHEQRSLSRGSATNVGSRPGSNSVSFTEQRGVGTRPTQCKPVQNCKPPVGSTSKEQREVPRGKAQLQRALRLAAWRQDRFGLNMAKGCPEDSRRQVA